ncbi:uncharacterized protein LOC110463792 isoform X2 [Mizuhopecten yessoensis]|uniref:uncharacterized protein LOC110463792 isoform X2 n=1 Tax=Mizuhopecten yessoensis TaxID=6573 RepID=UPI000B45D2C1|nr:uncharacterized protein LOC110463792 isoform X2 [Mizuhopecten yessoensis]
MPTKGGKVSFGGQLELPCAVHDDTESLFVCVQCSNLPVCTDCIKSTHSKHKVVKVDDHIPVLRKQVQQFVEKTKREKVDSMKQAVAVITEEVADNKTQGADIMENIDRRGKQLHEHLDKLINECKAECADTHLAYEQKLKSYNAKVLQRFAEIESDITTCKTSLKSSRTSDVISASQIASKQYKDIDHPWKPRFTVDEGEISTEEIRKLLVHLLVKQESKASESIKEKQTNPAKKVSTGCNSCGNKDCKCKTCSKCNYRGSDFIHLGRTVGRWQCPKCNKYF